MNFDENKYKQDWQKENMLQVKAAYKASFVKEFKAACDYLNLKQSKLIRKLMEDTIMKAQIKEFNDMMLHLSDDVVANFINKYNDKVIMSRDFEMTKNDIVNMRSCYHDCAFASTSKELVDAIINNPEWDTSYINEETVWYSQAEDSTGEPKYVISENDIWYLIAEWKDGMNDKDVFIFK